MTALAEPLKQQTSTSVLPSDQGRRLVLENISWQAYVAVGAALSDRPNLRMTYDGGRLELMTLSSLHERLKCILTRLVDVLAEEMDLDVGGFGSMTQQRQDLDRGLESDQCYYVRNLARVLGQERIDLTRDPPPDLAIEIDVTRSSLNRLAIYAALRIPEVWRYDGETFWVHRLNARGDYEVQDRSEVFPSVTVAELVPFVNLGLTQGDRAMVRAFRAWIQERRARP